jgi:hypothetical protein
LPSNAIETRLLLVARHQGNVCFLLPVVRSSLPPTASLARASDHPTTRLGHCRFYQHSQQLSFVHYVFPLSPQDTSQNTPYTTRRRQDTPHSTSSLFNPARSRLFSHLSQLRGKEREGASSGSREGGRSASGSAVAFENVVFCCARTTHSVES